MRRIVVLLTILGFVLLEPWTPVSASMAPEQRAQRPVSPLAAYPGFGHNALADEAQYMREEHAREAFIARCMNEQGMPYAPTPPVIVTGEVTHPQHTPDPNSAYADALGPEQRRAYYLVLYDVIDPNDEAVPTFGGGCMGDASRAIRGVYAAYGDLREPFMVLEQGVAADRRVLAAERRWSACMRDQGFMYATPLDLRAEPDRAAEVGRWTPEAEQHHAQAVAVAPHCERQAGLGTARAAARYKAETAFVVTHRARLDQHLADLRAQEPLIRELLNE